MRFPSRTTALVLGLGTSLLCSGCGGDKSANKAVRVGVGAATMGATEVKVDVPGVKVHVGSETPSKGRAIPLETTGPALSEPAVAAATASVEFPEGNTAELDRNEGAADKS